MKVLCIGDIMGEPGRRAAARVVPRLIAQHQIDAVIANGENVAGGFGITPELAEELFETGISVITTGNHAWDKKEAVGYFSREPRLLRPANYPPGVPGNGSAVIETAGGERLAVLQLMGRVYMPTIDCPFQTAKRVLSRLKQETSAIIVDMHGEATSEKMAMGHFLDGEVVAVVGTHTHVQTADEQILPKGTAYITDIGMTGPLHSVIGVKKELAIEKFLTGMPRRFEVASGPSVFCAVLLELDPRLGKAIAFERIRLVD
ncbi:MAG: TIGR00282 family metallophosphoesterase [Nitrospira sp.]|nr:TIGR00282 family metallophosphoesterase [Nitrospira sp.]MDH4244286.1 TIGR00282 family metallophosphoesterase [Nitrospira sp.]MDH4357841.1 TIGR00282 family metallophosphoesterase [Nitrospira sp.]MDH5318844.1 TIGR00282 family metallophosphoesterase [Nitrospira sp.]